MRGGQVMDLTTIGVITQVAGVFAVVFSLVYLARQVDIANRLARAEASRTPNSDLNALNATFGTDPVFRSAFQNVLRGAIREDVEPEARLAIDMYLISMTNLQDQLVREIQAGILDEDAQDFGGAGLFLLPYYRSSWPLFRPYFNTNFVRKFETQHNFDLSLDAQW